MTDTLLEWMSFRRSGRMGDVPAGLADVKSFRRIVENFAVLGHLELLADANWKIAPPTLAGLSAHRTCGAAAVLCGARTPGVLASLNAACHSIGAQVTTSSDMPGQPAVIRVTAASSAELASVASVARIPLQHDAAFTLLACIPTIRHWPRTPCPMVDGRVETVRRFSRADVDWVESTLAEAAAAKNGFFRIKRDWDWVSVLKTDVSECAYIDDRAGRLAAAAKLKVVSWSASSRTLELPAQLLPPVAIARALALCTGSLPRYDKSRRQVSFGDISPEILRLTLAITGLKLA